MFYCLHQASARGGGGGGGGGRGGEGGGGERLHRPLQPPPGQGQSGSKVRILSAKLLLNLFCDQHLFLKFAADLKISLLSLPIEK